MTDDLISWLTQQLDEDERIARSTFLVEGDDGEWIVSFNPDTDEATGVLGRSIHIGMIGGNGDLDEVCQAEHIVRFNPARVLREVEAKRQILAQHPPGEDGYCGDGLGLDGCKWDWPCPTVRLLTLPYADRPGFKEEWRDRAMSDMEIYGLGSMWADEITKLVVSPFNWITAEIKPVAGDLLIAFVECSIEWDCPVGWTCNGDVISRVMMAQDGDFAIRLLERGSMKLHLALGRKVVGHGNPEA
jgi:hypothetical protein